jgi:hypothetical protein
LHCSEEILTHRIAVQIAIEKLILYFRNSYNRVVGVLTSPVFLLCAELRGQVAVLSQIPGKGVVYRQRPGNKPGTFQVKN